ncbi:MAG: tRNA (adenosine(37)-N6)-threonylcarbamoyltransferase complex ATPase subunit type 1 TsaE [Magnetococcales bacterium]|nr:tRNA (adenosine(37)-N6)-threonylcarbamoyltransferase complex ATPase subunit type 1 TsaE [Magnetococcales bacterium]
MADTLETTTDSERATEALAAAWASVARPGSVLLLQGILGAGKTVFARGFVRGMGQPGLVVTSPTFTLMNPYPDGRLPVYHFDLYRLGDSGELSAIGAEEFLDGAGVALVEWPQRGGDLLPPDHLLIDMDPVPEHPRRRRLRMTAMGPRSREMLDAFRRTMGATSRG